MGRKLSRSVVAWIDHSKIMGIRAGAKSDHRFTGVWPIVIDGRVFARSWTQKKDGWFKTFLEDPLGALHVDDREVRVRAVRVKSGRIRDAIERAYAEKYPTKYSMKYVRGFRTQKRRDTTTEFVPR